ncbi:MAG: hypothetical protein IKQ71_03735 [Lachnospiraceae bacterium]|nr:hypothetical protein [Lachnospiraceae bacterium]
MKEQLYTIPVTDAFNEDCECPICAMRRSLERNAIEYTMGPSYMEDDNRAMTDKLGFCGKHIRDLYNEKNRLGLALMLNTHMDKVIKDLKQASSDKPSGGGLFKKATGGSSVVDYVKGLKSTCFICGRIEDTFQRYVNTIFHMWKKDSSFKDAVKSCKGFCVEHYGLLYENAAKELSGNDLTEFLQTVDKVFFDNIERVNEDVAWFINKYDYRYKDEPWKNAKDSIPRAIIKTNSAIIEGE